MEFDLEYNSGRTLMIIPEYGRHVQKLVDHCLALETKEERNEMALAIVDVMGNLQQQKQQQQQQPKPVSWSL